MKTNTAVLHLKGKDTQKVYNLSGKVNTNMVASKTVFTDPDPTMEAFGTEIAKLDTYIKAKDGSKVKAQAVIDFDDIVGYQFVFIEVDWIDPIGFTDKFIEFLTSEVELNEIDISEV